MGSEANASEMKILLHQIKIQEEEKRLEEMKEKYEKDYLKLHWYEGFWMGFTTGAAIVTELYGIIRG